MYVCTYVSWQNVFARHDACCMFLHQEQRASELSKLAVSRNAVALTLSIDAFFQQIKNAKGVFANFTGRDHTNDALLRPLGGATRARNTHTNRSCRRYSNLADLKAYILNSTNILFASCDITRYYRARRVGTRENLEYRSLFPRKPDI